MRKHVTHSLQTQKLTISLRLGLALARYRCKCGSRLLLVQQFTSVPQKQHQIFMKSLCPPHILGVLLLMQRQMHG